MNHQSNEVWKSVAGYSGIYEVSNLGRVRSFHSLGGRRKHTARVAHRILTPARQHNGQMKVTLCKDGRHTDHYVSRLVAAAFLPVPPVYFLDGNPSNLSADNIRYCSRAESKKHTGGAGGGKVKLDAEQVQQIREKYAKGEPCRERYRKRTVTYADLAKEYEVGISTISHVINEVTHRQEI